MIKELYAKNFALIDEIRVSFQSGLNIITGETGAGKSILMGALNALLGDRIGKDIIRHDADKAIVEGIFELAQNQQVNTFLHENDIEADDSLLIIRREVLENGRTRCFVNDSPVTLTVLASLGDLLVDLHGQHEHQLLLKVDKHIEYLDAFGHNDSLLSQQDEIFTNFVSAINKLHNLLQHRHEIVQTKDIHKFQLKEIKAVSPLPNEDQELEDREHVLRNAEVLYETCNSLFQKLYENDGSVIEILDSSLHSLKNMETIDKNFNSLVTECENAKILIDDLSNALQEYSSNLTFDPQEIEELRNRLAALNGLKKKYGGTIDAVIEHQHKLEELLSVSENVDASIDKLSGEIDLLRNKLKNISLRLSEKRQETGLFLSEKVADELKNLGMPNVKYTVSQRYKETDSDRHIDIDGKKIKVTFKGIDQVEFFISTNSGEKLKPLAQVVSGGEVSRIMLALKTLLAEADQVPVLVFDEIDNGISGRIAQSVGYSLKKLAHSHQVICITHLPQIASMADHHYLVEKLEGERVHTSIRKLDDEQRINQIASLLSGHTITDSHLNSAKDLLQAANEFNN